MIFCFSFSFLIKPDPLIFQPPDSCTSSPSRVASFTFLLLCLFHLKLLLYNFSFYIYFLLFPVYIYFSLSTLTSFSLCLSLSHPPFSSSSVFIVEFFFSPSFHLSVSFPASPSPCSFSVQGSKMLQSKSLLNSYYSGTHTSSHTICLVILH